MMTCPHCGERAKSLLGWLETFNPFAIRCQSCGAHLKLTTTSWVLVGLLFAGFLVGVGVALTEGDRTTVLFTLLGLGLVGELASYAVVRFDVAEVPADARSTGAAQADAAGLRPAVMTLAAMAWIPLVIGIGAWFATSSLHDLGLGVAYAITFAAIARGLSQGRRPAWVGAVAMCLLQAILLALLFVVFQEELLTGDAIDRLRERGQSVWRVSMLVIVAGLGTLTLPTLLSRRVRGALEEPRGA